MKQRSKSSSILRSVGHELKVNPPKQLAKTAKKFGSSRAEAQRKAAEAAHCAAEQGKFWEMHDILFAQNGNLDVGQYVNYAKKLGLEAFAFDLCLGSGKQSAKINRNLASGTSIGINATPSFIIARSERGDIVSGGNIITGAQPYEQFRQAIDQALAAK